MAERSVAEVKEALRRESEKILAEDIDINRRMGKNGQRLIPEKATILTHCNAGALATGGYGTALGVIRAAHEAGKNVKVIADETRPWLQGLRLTAFELMEDGIPVTEPVLAISLGLGIGEPSRFVNQEHVGVNAGLNWDPARPDPILVRVCKRMGPSPSIEVTGHGHRLSPRGIQCELDINHHFLGWPFDGNGGWLPPEKDDHPHCCRGGSDKKR